MYLLALGCHTLPISWNRVIISCGGFFLVLVCLVKSKAGLFTCSWIQIKKGRKILDQSQRHLCSTRKCLKLFSHFTARPALLHLDIKLPSSWVFWVVFLWVSNLPEILVDVFFFLPFESLSLDLLPALLVMCSFLCLNLWNRVMLLSSFVNPLKSYSWRASLLPLFFSCCEESSFSVAEIITFVLH